MCTVSPEEHRLSQLGVPVGAGGPLPAPAPAPTRLPDDPDVGRMILSGAAAADVAAAHPSSSSAWAALAAEALGAGRAIEGYAYARVGYHRGLDALRKSGWRGQGPVPWSHEPNQGFLSCLALLSRAAGAIGEDDERDRCRQFLIDCDPAAAQALGLAGTGAGDRLG